MEHEAPSDRPEGCPDQPEERPETRTRGYEEDLRNQYIQLPLAIMLDLQASRLTYRDVCVYCYLLGRQMKNDKLWWSIDSLAALTQIPVTGINESLAKLARSGHIVRGRERGKITTVTRCITKVEAMATGVRIVVKGEAAKAYESKPPGHMPTQVPSEQSPANNS